MQKVAFIATLFCWGCSQTWGYLTTPFNPATLTADSTNVCKVRVIDIGENGKMTLTNFQPPLITTKRVATVRRLVDLKGTTGEQSSIAFPKSANNAFFTELERGEVCLVFLKGNGSPDDFTDFDNGKFAAVPQSAGAIEDDARDNVVAELLLLEKHGNAEQRLQAIDGLGQFDRLKGVARLAELYRDENPVVRAKALAAGINAGDAPPLPILIETLQLPSGTFSEADSFKKYRTNAYRMDYLQSGIVQAVEFSVKPGSSLEAKGKGIAKFDYLKFIHDALSIQALQGDARMRRELASTLRELADPKSVDDLYVLLDDSDSEVRYYAATALQRIFHIGEFPAVAIFKADEKHYVDFWKSHESELKQRATQK